MGLHVDLRKLVPQLAGGIELVCGTRGRETRRDGVHQAVLAVPLLQQQLGIIVTALGGIQQVIRRVAVHHYLAGGNAQPQALRFLEEGVDRLRENRAVHAARGDAIPDVLAQEDFCHGSRESFVCVLTLGGECVLVQPVQQLLAEGRDHGRLGKVHVAVEEAGRDQRVGTVVLHLDPGR